MLIIAKKLYHDLTNIGRDCSYPGDMKTLAMPHAAAATSPVEDPINYYFKNKKTAQL